jgi:hypothetical protein
MGSSQRSPEFDNFGEATPGARRGRDLRAMIERAYDSRDHTSGSRSFVAP